MNRSALIGVRGSRIVIGALLACHVAMALLVAPALAKAQELAPMSGGGLVDLERRDCCAIIRQVGPITNA